MLFIYVRFIVHLPNDSAPHSLDVPDCLIHMEFTAKTLIPPVERCYVTFMPSNEEVSAIPGVVDGVRAQPVQLQIKILEEKKLIQ